MLCLNSSTKCKICLSSLWNMLNPAACFTAGYGAHQIIPATLFIYVACLVNLTWKRLRWSGVKQEHCWLIGSWERIHERKPNLLNFRERERFQKKSEPASLPRDGEISWKQRLKITLQWFSSFMLLFFPSYRVLYMFLAHPKDLDPVISKINYFCSWETSWTALFFQRKLTLVKIQSKSIHRWPAESWSALDLKKSWIMELSVAR